MGYPFKEVRITKENLHMFSLGNGIVLAPLVPGGQKPFLESLVTEREVTCSLGQL